MLVILVPDFRREIPRLDNNLDRKCGLAKSCPDIPLDFRCDFVEDKKNDTCGCDVMSRRRNINSKPVISKYFVFYKRLDDTKDRTPIKVHDYIDLFFPPKR
jgi:hypothetical protein